MKTSKPSASNAGRTIPKVTRLKVADKPAPHMLAASSKAASEFRNTGASNRKANGDHKRTFNKDHPAQRINVDIGAAAAK